MPRARSNACWHAHAASLACPRGLGARPPPFTSHLPIHGRCRIHAGAPAPRPSVRGTALVHPPHNFWPPPLRAGPQPPRCLLLSAPLFPANFMTILSPLCCRAARRPPARVSCRRRPLLLNDHTTATSTSHGARSHKNFPGRRTAHGGVTACGSIYSRVGGLPGPAPFTLLCPAPLPRRLPGQRPCMPPSWACPQPRGAAPGGQSRGTEGGKRVQSA